MAKFKDLTGQIFGKLTVIGISKKVQSGKRIRYYWKCKCECGKYHDVRTDSLISGNIQSCGCLHKEQAIKNVSLHHSHKQSGSRLYGIWRKMKDRCLNENVPCYSRYGGRGIDICDEWKNDFEAFLKWALENGYNEHLTIDRKDNSKGYSPDNCRWATNKEQSRNRRSNIVVSYKGKEMTLIEAAEKSALSYSALSARWHRGIRGEELFAEVIVQGKKREVLYQGKIVTLKELSELTGININTLKTRYRAGKRGNDLIK